MFQDKDLGIYFEYMPYLIHNQYSIHILVYILGMDPQCIPVNKYMILLHFEIYNSHSPHRVTVRMVLVFPWLLAQLLEKNLCLIYHSPITFKEIGDGSRWNIF